MATESKLRMAGLEPWRSERRSRDPSPELGLGSDHHASDRLYRRPIDEAPSIFACTPNGSQHTCIYACMGGREGWMHACISTCVHAQRKPAHLHIRMHACMRLLHVAREFACAHCSADHE